MLLTPRPIAPGWAGRWTRQSLELFHRQPVLILANAALFLLVNAFAPANLISVAFSAILLIGGLFSSLRATDQDSGRGWSTAYHFFRQTIPDLLKLSLTVGVTMYLTQVIMNGIIHWILLMGPHFLSVVNNDPKLSKDWPFWLKTVLQDSPNVITLGILWPGVLQLIFLTQAVGNAPIRHFQLGNAGAMLNPEIAYRLLFFGFVLCFSLVSIASILTSIIFGYIVAGIFAFLYVWLGTWGYLWCREMFEGTKENAKATQSQRVGSKQLNPI